MSAWSKKAINDYVIEFSKADDHIYAPSMIGGRYIIDDILSTSGGFGIIFTAQDTRVLGRKTLIKARRYDKEPGLFSYAYDISRKEKIEKIREQILFEFDCLLEFRRQGESRMPNVNDLVKDFSPFINGPHKDKDGNTFSVDDKELFMKEPYIIMQMIEGQNLGDYISQGIEQVLKDRNYDRYQDWEENVLQYALELCTIFEGFHRKNLLKDNAYFIYQDLKPQNIMITYDMFLTLIDFGAMTLVRDDRFGRSVSNWPDHGSPGTGTWGYMPPEMNPQEKMLGELDQRVDVYALGATLYHLLTGDDPSQLPNQYGPLPLEKLKQGKFQVTDATCELVEGATRLDRNQRFSNMNEMLRQVYDALKQVKMAKRN